MQFASTRQALDRSHVVSDCFDRERETREDGDTVDRDGARTAVPHLAAVFGSGEIDVFAQDFEECFIRIEGAFDVSAVDAKAGQDFGRRDGHGSQTSFSLVNERSARWLF